MTPTRSHFIEDTAISGPIEFRNVDWDFLCGDPSPVSVRQQSIILAVTVILLWRSMVTHNSLIGYGDTGIYDLQDFDIRKYQISRIFFDFCASLTHEN